MPYSEEEPALLVTYGMNMAHLAAQGMPLRALILDHDPEYADILADALSFVGDGPETWTTTSPEVVRQRVRRGTYDIIMLTRESEGERFLVDVRRFQPDAVIVVTSDAILTARQISEQFAAGADEVVQRPFHPSVLTARLNRLVLARSSATRLGEAQSSRVAEA